MRAKLHRIIVGTAAICLASIAGGCSDRLSEARPAGNLALTLSLPDVVIDTVHFELRRSGFSRSGDIDVSAPGATASALIGGVPAGAGYLMTLSAMATDGITTCSGSATVDVTTNATTPLAVTVECRRTSDLGAVIGNARLNLCPDVSSLAATPAMVTVGDLEAIDLTAVASDLDGDALTFAWSAPVGTFDNAAAAQTVYRCAAPGSVTVTVTVSDGNCETLVMAPLVCLPFCANKPNGTACNDQDACTQVDSCQGGQCVGGDAVVCAALNQCHFVGICEPSDGICPNPVAPDGFECQLPGATAACAAGDCAIASCNAGVRNCNGVTADGCETSVITNDNCGTCGHVCSAGTNCESGLCLSPPPTGVAAVAGGWKIAITWTSSPGATSYEVLRGTSAAGPFQSVGTSTGNRLVDLAVLSGVPYFYVVTARNAEGTSAHSAAASATALTKQLCVNSNSQHAVFVFDATQSGAATPVRTMGGSAEAFGWPTAVAASLLSDELFVVQQGGSIDVFPLGANGAVAPLRHLLAAVPGGIFFGLDVDAVASEVYVVNHSPGGQLLSMEAGSGTATRIISGRATQLGNAPGLVIDRSHGEVLVSITGNTTSATGFPRIQAFDITGGDGNIAPKRVLGGPGNTAVGSWAIAHDRSRDQIFTTCNCNNSVTVFDRTASGNASPVRTLVLPPSVLSVYALLMDEAADTVWALARTGSTSYSLMELPRGGSGSVAPLHPPITLATAGRLAPCN